MLRSIAIDTPIARVGEFNNDMFKLCAALDRRPVRDPTDDLFKGTAKERKKLKRWRKESRENILNEILTRAGYSDEVKRLMRDTNVGFHVFVRCSNYNIKAKWLKKSDPDLLLLAAQYYLEQERLLKSILAILAPARMAIYSLGGPLTDCPATRMTHTLARENNPPIFDFPHGKHRYERVAKALYIWGGGEYNPLMYKPDNISDSAIPSSTFI